MKSQRGGFAIGLIVGLMIGLAVALGVALYVTKVPVPFVNKVPQRTPEQDAAEVEKNRNWDPNGPLYGKNPARPNMVPPSSGAASTAVPGTTRNVPSVVAPQVPDIAAAPATKASSAAGRHETGEGTAVRPSLPVPPTASTKAGSDPFSYFVQVGAFARPEDAEQQRARLAMLGFGARVTEREQAGRTMYRVRVGPFDRKDDADSAKDKLDGSGIESSLVRVQK